jgi:beta-lactamase class A
MIDRRLFLFSAATALACKMAHAAPDSSLNHRLGSLRAGLGAGARLGVAALDTGTGRRLAFDAGSRYAMCSTFKAVLAGAVLARADRGLLSLADRIPVRRSDLVPHAPAVTQSLARGRMSVEELCAAIVEVSDNSAANLLLDRIGGPRGFTAFARRCGDTVTRLDRKEPELNSNILGDPRDTTTPAAMLRLMGTLLLGEILSPASRTRLAGWMERSATGRARLRAGLPAGWRAGDKTGTANGANNDIAIAWPPGRAPVLIASFIDARGASNASRDAAHAQVARLVAERFA